MKKKKSSAGITIVVTLIVVVLIAIFVLVGMLVSQNKNKQVEADVTTENAYAVNDEKLFAKYGNFKSYDSAIGVIRNSMQNVEDANTSIEQEVFQYWFALVRYADYEDAYSFVAQDAIHGFGIEYSYEAFQSDCLDMRIGGTDEKNLALIIEVLPWEEPLEQNNGFGVSSKRMAVIYSKGNEANAYYLPFYITDDYHIIPFDINAVSPMERYGAVDLDISTNPEQYIPQTTESSTDSTDASEDLTTQESGNTTENTGESTGIPDGSSTEQENSTVVSQ